MSDLWDSFLEGFDEYAEKTQPELEPDPLWEQLDALYEERVRRGDRRWFPPGPDPQGLEKLVRERRARQRGEKPELDESARGGLWERARCAPTRRRSVRRVGGGGRTKRGTPFAAATESTLGA